MAKVPKVGETWKLTDGRTAVVKFFGDTKFAKGKWVGIEVQGKDKGKHDGTVKGKSYFKCKRGQGAFVKPEKLKAKQGGKKKGGGFKKGQAVEVYSNKTKKWLDATLVGKKGEKYEVKVGSKQLAVPMDRVRAKGGAAKKADAKPKAAPKKEAAKPTEPTPKPAPKKAAPAPAAEEKKEEPKPAEPKTEEQPAAKEKPAPVEEAPVEEAQPTEQPTGVESSEVKAIDAIKKFFNFYDKDGNGFIEEKEAVNIFKGWGNSEENSQALWKDMLSTADDNSDGKVSADEYFDYFTSQLKTPDDIDAAGNLVAGKLAVLDTFAANLGFSLLSDDKPTEPAIDRAMSLKVDLDPAASVEDMPDLPAAADEKKVSAGDEDEKGQAESGLPPNMAIPRTMSEDARMRFTENQGDGGNLLLIVAGGHESMMSLKGAMEKPTDTVEGFTTSDATWKELAKIPGGPRSGMGFCTYKGKFTIAGGWTNQMFEAMCDDILQYDHVKDEWAEIGKLPEGLWGLRMVEHDGNLVISGGKPKGKVECTASCKSWDGSDWKDLPDMSKPRAKHCMAIVDGKIVVAGGLENIRNPHAETHSEWFDGSKWDRLPPMNVQRACMGWCTYEDKLTVVGGRDNNGATDTVECLNLGRMQWKKMTRMLNPRSEVVAASLNDHLFVVGGDAIMTGGATRKTAEYYDEENWKWFLLPDAQYKRASAAYCVIKL